MCFLAWREKILKIKFFENIKYEETLMQKSFCKLFIYCKILILSIFRANLKNDQKNYIKSYLTTKGYLQLENSTQRLEISLKAKLPHATMRLVSCRRFQLQVAFCCQRAFTKTFQCLVLDARNINRIHC